jgi:hypothetical protein
MYFGRRAREGGIDFVSHPTTPLPEAGSSGVRDGTNWEEMVSVGFSSAKRRKKNGPCRFFAVIVMPGRKLRTRGVKAAGTGTRQRRARIALRRRAQRLHYGNMSLLLVDASFFVMTVAASKVNDPRL